MSMLRIEYQAGMIRGHVHVPARGGSGGRRARVLAALTQRYGTLEILSEQPLRRPGEADVAALAEVLVQRGVITEAERPSRLRVEPVSLEDEGGDD